MSKFQIGDLVELPLSQGQPAFGRVLGVITLGRLDTRYYEIQLLQPISIGKHFVQIDLLNKQGKLLGKAAEVLFDSLELKESTR